MVCAFVFYKLSEPYAKITNPDFIYCFWVNIERTGADANKNNNQCAATLGDVLLRRVPVALGACWSDSCSRSAAMRIATVMRWSDSQTAAELEAFENERAEFLRKPARSNVLLQTAAD